MPRFGKKSLSLFLRNKCERQFINSLYSGNERKNYGFPAKQNSRFGLKSVGEAGYKWQNKKTDELTDAFDQENVIIDLPADPKKQPGRIDLLPFLKNTNPLPLFIVEAFFKADNEVFQAVTGFDELIDSKGKKFSISDMQMDVLQIMPPLNGVINKDSQLPAEDQKYRSGVNPDGTLFEIKENDKRYRLRVIDIKQNTDPGHSYFAEVVYYSMALAAWLESKKLSGKFVVIAAPAIWAGGYKDKRLVKLTAAYKNKLLSVPRFEALTALSDSVVIADMDVYAPRLRRLFREELPELLKKEWDELNWHVDSRCKGCEWLGYPWKKGESVSADLCLPEAERIGHLSRIVGLSMGSKKFLGKRDISTVKELGKQNIKSEVFDDHQTLRSKRNVFPHRAKVLQSGQPSQIPYSGDITLMPRYASLRIFIFLDFDLSTAITSVFGIQAYWNEPFDYDSKIKKNNEGKKNKWGNRYDEELGQYEERLSFVDRADIEVEGREFKNFLKKLKRILEEVSKTDREDIKAKRRKVSSSYQIYLWDELQYKHLVRLLERHLILILSDDGLRDLAWLFPPPQLLQSPASATRKTPFTFVSEVVKNQVAIPAPHTYNLVEVAKSWKPDNVNISDLNIYYQEPMSDLIPPERVHYYWNKEEDWMRTQKAIEIATNTKLTALAAITWKLEREFKTELAKYAAPNIPDRKPDDFLIAPLSQLWLEYKKLDNNLRSVETLQTLSMPAHEKEAKLKSARLDKLIKGAERAKALKILGEVIGENLTTDTSLLVYKIKENSKDVNIKPGDLNFVLSPEYLPDVTQEKNKGVRKFLDLHINSFLKENDCFAGTDFKEWCEQENFTFRPQESGTIKEIGLTGVSVKSIDRSSGYIALERGRSNNIEGLELHPNIDFSKLVILDSVHIDYLIKPKLEPTLQGIGYYRSKDDEKIFGTLKFPQKAKQKKDSEVPAVDVFWKTKEMAATPTGYEPEKVRPQLEKFLESSNKSLDISQWDAWNRALSHRFTIIWGPPGTGKSWTLRNIIIGAVMEAEREAHPLRLLVTAGTNTAITNILYKLEQEFREYGIESLVNLYQLTSRYYQIPKGIRDEYPNLKIQRISSKSIKDKYNIENVLDELNAPKSISVIGCTPQQLHNLAVFGVPKKKDYKLTIRSWFDFIVLDEASQIDIPSTSLVYSKMTKESICVIAGDNLQLPPIQKASPPEGLENLVGSAYDFFRFHREVEPVSLDVNYRSNQEIVDLTKTAGYDSKLESFSPDLKLNFLSPVPLSKPNNWNEDFYWTEKWAELLDPDKPVTCFVYEDDESSQINEFEADSITSLVILLRNRMNKQLLNDNTAGSSSIASLYDPVEFWKKAVGIVTPHKVQMSKIIDKLQSVFPANEAQGIREAVDTVERFQGQQRDVILCSFGIGDADIIKAEDEFLFKLNRFNVIASRSRAKFIVFLTRTFLDHLSDDQEVLADSSLIKSFAEQFCNKGRKIDLGFIENGEIAKRKGVIRWRKQLVV